MKDAERPGRSAASTDAKRDQSSQWTTRALLDWMSGAFETMGLDSPRLMAELLLAHVVGCDRLRLYMDADRPSSDLERQMLRELVARAMAHEPIQYLVGEAWFFSLPLKVDRRVMIPRPSSETLVEHVLQQVRADPGLAPGGELIIGDVCTGSGCLAIALAVNLPHARVVATDVSSDALGLAAENARRHQVADRVAFIEGWLLDPLRSRLDGDLLHVLVSNPPYIPDCEWDDVPPNVKGHEPELALRGGPDGLTSVRPIVEDAPAMLRPGGLLLVEIASATAPEVLDLARSNALLEEPWIEDDFEGLPRVLVARRAAA